MNDRTRIPQEPRQKALYFLSMAQDELAVHHLQSAENLLRLAVVMSPEDKSIHALLDEVVRKRREHSS